VTQAAVSNAGPLIVLAKLNLLHLLKHLYERVEIPNAVYEETVIVGLQRGYEDAHVLRQFLEQARWTPTRVTVPPDIASLPLDLGEQESLALALQDKVLLLMDEERGRAVARQRGLTVLGTLGVLVRAYRDDLITSDQLRFHFRQITSRDDVWISSSLCQRVLHNVLGRPAESTGT
jgi:uncharacterized protein